MRGGDSCDGPLIIDPTQSVVVLMLYCYEPGSLARHEGVLVVRAATLVGYMTSTHTGQRIPWDDWKRDVMVVETPPRGLFYVQPLVLGSRVLFTLYNLEDSTGGSWAHVYDFSRWGCRALVRAGDGEDESRVVPNPKAILFPREHDFGRVTLRALGNSLVSCAVSDSLESLVLRGLTSGARRMRRSLAIYTFGS
jgi:hypothetical protein